MPDYPRRRLPQTFLPLTVPVFQILLSLSDQDLHGYAIIQDVRERTEGEVELTADEQKFLVDHGSGNLSDEFYTWLVAETIKTLRKYM